MKKREKKVRTYTYALGILIIFIMVGSMIGFNTDTDSSKKIEYNDIKFIQQQVGWSARIKDQQMTFLYNPLELENITLPQFNLNAEKIYLALDQEPGELNYQYVTGRLRGIFIYFTQTRVVDACLKEQEEKCPQELPLVDCKDSKFDIFHFRQANTTEIKKQGSCIQISAEDNLELERITERIIYKILGVMP